MQRRQADQEFPENLKCRDAKVGVDQESVEPSDIVKNRLLGFDLALVQAGYWDLG